MSHVCAFMCFEWYMIFGLYHDDKNGMQAQRLRRYLYQNRFTHGTTYDLLHHQLIKQAS